ncbi:lysine transporter LysE [Fusobacterium sp.]|uniref:LysE family translocator n=1 Tax=Fusobacterium sp. TaxID=68766 RepID=UPI002631A6D7|nr:lysine transporter LysE [Fusobacterium sp.]
MNITFFKGIITGIILSLPFGPVGLYCMEKTLTEGKKDGFSTALGMITSDVVYGLIAFFFINQAEEFILKYEFFFKALVGLCLIILGIKKLKTPVVIKKPTKINEYNIQNYFSGFFLSIINVTGIITIIFIYTLLSVVGDANNYIFLAAGIATAGIISWTINVQVLTYFKKFITDDLLIKLSKLSSFIILTFGVISLGYIVVNL